MTTKTEKTLDRLFVITLNDAGADMAITAACEEQFQEEPFDTIYLTFLRPCFHSDEDDTYYLEICSRFDDWREQLWNDLSCLRQLGFTTIEQHQS